jgi:hypothetical protein
MIYTTRVFERSQMKEAATICYGNSLYVHGYEARKLFLEVINNRYYNPFRTVLAYNAADEPFAWCLTFGPRIARGPETWERFEGACWRYTNINYRNTGVARVLWNLSGQPYTFGVHSFKDYYAYSRYAN